MLCILLCLLVGGLWGIAAVGGGGAPNAGGKRVSDAKTKEEVAATVAGATRLGLLSSSAQRELEGVALSTPATGAFPDNP